MAFKEVEKKTFALDVFQRKEFEHEFNRGDRVRIFVKELTGAWVNAYFLDTKNYRNFLNRRSFEYWGNQNQTAITIDVDIENDDIYFLVVQHNKDIRLSRISVKIRLLDQ